MENYETEKMNNYYGTVCAVIASVFSKKKFKAKDFFGKAKKEQTIDEMAAFFEAMTRALGGEIIG